MCYFEGFKPKFLLNSFTVAPCFLLERWSRARVGSQLLLKSLPV